jgi:uncharacterized protein
VRHELSFTAGCLFELLLLVLALVWAGLFHWPAAANFYWNWASAGLGIVAAIPLFGFFIWTMRSKLPLWSHHQQLLEAVVRPLFERWSVVQLFAISLVAGISEEAFFRGAIQGGLAERVPVLLALVLASALFGACHLLTWTYAIIAAFIGAYLGLLWMWTGNLLTPMATHAAYDFAALVFLLRGCGKPQDQSPGRGAH